MAGWLTAAVITGVLGNDISAEIDTAGMAVLEKFADGAQEYVESQRPDLILASDADLDGVLDTWTFVPGADVVLGAALLAYRFYQRRRSLGSDPSQTFASLAESEDPDIARLLGVGSHGRFVFGAALTVTTTETI